MPLGISRSHSPPLPPNATYHHPIIALKILPSAKLFLAGSKLTGILEVTCQERNSVALGQLAIEFAGTEELKLLDHTAQSSLHGPHKCIFQGPALPPSNAVASSEAPIAGHYYTALRGRTKFPFTFPLPSHLPSSTNFDGRARVSYALKATCQVLTIQSRQNVLVTKSIPIRIVERLVDWNDAQYHEPLEVRGEQAAGGGVGVWAEAKIDKRLYYHQNSSTPNDGLIPVLLTVKNNSRRMLSGGINAKICRKLVLPNQPSTSLDPSRIQVVRNCSFRGLEYEFPPASGQAKTVKLSCQLPNSRQDDDQHQDSSCISVKGTKLFSLSMFLRIEIELGALSDDLVVDLPIHVAHPSSLPNELLIRNATPLTIDHDRSSNPLSIAHLGEPQSSGRVSRNTSRSSSPHPPSLQPGNISRSASPRLSLNITGDWGLPSSASAPPSPIRSPHFSPLPTPRHSPLPSPRFSSPLPFSPSSTVPNHHPSEASVISPATYFSPAASWSNPAALPYAIDRVPVAPTPAPGFYPTASQHDFPTYPLQSHPAHPIPSQDLPSQVPPSDPPYPPHPISQPVFSPPTTPWRRQTVSTSSNFDPSASYPSSTPQPNLSYQPIPQASTQTSPFSIHSRPHPPTYSQEPFHHPNPQGVDTSYSLRSSWRTRHQSLPVAPAPPPHYSHHLSNEHEGQNLSDNSSGLSRRPSNSSRRTSEPISNSPWPNGHPHPPLNAGPTTPRKRALPKPPQACDLSETSVPHSFHSQNGLNTTQDQPHHNSTLPSQDPLNSGQHSRLETIGEASESRPGTLSGKQVSRDILNVLATWDNPQDSDQDDFRPPQSRRATRVVSHPRSMRPRRSDGSDSVQALEDVVSKEDDRRSIDERSPAAGPSPDRNSCPSEQQMSLDRSSSLNPRQASPSILDHTPQSPGHNSKARPSDSSSRHPEPALSAVRERLSPSPSPQKSQPSHPTGLANLAQFLTRATSTEPPRTSSAPGADPNSRNSSLDQRRDEKPDLHSKDEKPTHAIGPNYSGSALRIKSTGISYGEAFVDAVPSPTCANANSAPEPKSVTSTHADKSAWKPPPALTNQPSDTPRTSIVGQIDLPNNSPSDEPLIARESVAPDALFPQFQLDPLPSVKEERDSAPQGSLEKIPPNLIASSDSKSSSASQPPRHPTPLSIPSDSPLVKKKSSRSPKKVAQPKKQTGAAAATQSLSDIQTTPVPPPHLVSNDRKSMSPSPQTTIVERLRSRNEEATAALKAAEQLKAHDDPAINKMHDALTTAVHEVLSRPYEAGIMNHNAGRLGSDGKIHLLEKTASARPVEDPTRAHASSSPTQPLNFRRSLPTPAARQPSSVSTHHPHTTTEFSSTVSKVDSVTAPLVPRLSAIPKSTSPLSIKGSGSYNASDPIPHRPLPISLGNSRNIRTSGVSLSPVSDLTSFKPLSSTSTYASHMLSQTRASSQTIRDPLVVIEPERQRSEYLHLGDRSKISTAGTACSPTSPTNLARKSRIKRLSSSTYTPSDLPNGSTVTGYGGTRDELSKITRVPGGWNDEESNEIEAELMEALRQTNLAVQKATSHRLSTPQFSKSPSLNRSLILSNLLSTSDTRRSSLGRESLDADRLRASISLMGGNRQDRYDRRTSIDRNLYGAGRGGQALDGPQADESSKEMAYDEDQPIPLTTGEYKSMRGGRGGRVSSVVGQWAKLTAADEPVTSVLRKDSEASSRSSWALESNRNKSLSKELISTRGISIKPKNSNHSTGYSITGLLSRNSSLASQQSSSSTIRLAHHNQPDSKNDDDGHPREVNDPSSSHLPPVPKFNLPGLISPSAARTLPPIPRPITATTTTTTTTTMAANESHPRVKQDRNSNPIGYRNLANRLSGTTIMNPSVSQSSPSISSLNSLRQQFGHRSKPTMTTTTTTSSSSSSSSRSSSTSSFTSSTCSSDRIQKLNAGGRPHLGMTSGTSGAHSPAQDRLDRTQRRHSSLLHQLHGLHTSRHHPTSTTSGTGGGGISELVRRWES